MCRVPNREQFNLSFETLTSDDTVQLLRTIQTTDIDLWNTISLRQDKTADLEPTETNSNDTMSQSNDAQSQQKREESGINCLDEDCLEDDSAVPMGGVNFANGYSSVTAKLLHSFSGSVCARFWRGTCSRRGRWLSCSCWLRRRSA